MSIFVIKNEKMSFFLTKVEKFRITRKWNIMLGKEWESVLTYISSLWVRKCRKIRSWFILNNVFCEKLSSGKLSEWEIVVWEIVWVGNCLLRNCLMGKSLLGKCRWENVCWESVTLGRDIDWGAFWRLTLFYNSATPLIFRFWIILSGFHFRVYT